nr:ribonuclease H-like domain, reverse transcriptase, RNA-dependent DNA polymerase [Tanacetum cinerariifolium]
MKLESLATWDGARSHGEVGLISWQYKKQTVIATLSTEAEYVSGASCCAQVLWIQNQVLDYGLQALVDKKRVVVTEAAIRDALHLDDAEGVDCLPNEEIYIELARMGYEKPTTKLTFYKAFFSSQWKFLIHTILQSMCAKRTSWNEFSSVMASAVICLSTGDLSTHSTKYISPALTQKVDVEEEGNEKEQGNEEEQGNADTTAEEPETAVPENATNDQPIPLPTPLTPPPQQPQDLEKTNKAKTLKLRRLRKVGTSQRVDTSDDTLMEDVSNQGRVIDRVEDAVKKADEVKEYTANTQVKGRQADIYNIDMDHAAKVLSMQEEESEVQEPVKVVTTAKLITEFVVAVSETVSATAVIPSAIPETISDAAAVPTDPEEESSAKTPTETTSKDMGKGILVEEPKPINKKQQVELDEAYARKLQEEINQDIDWEVAMDHVKQKAKEEPFIQRYQVMKKRPQTEAQARRNMIMYLKNNAGFRLDYFKGMNYDDIRPIFLAKYNANMEFLLKSKEHIEEEESRAIALINQTPAQKATKRRKLIEEAKEAKTLKTMFERPDGQDNVWRNQSTVHGLALVKSWKLLTSCGVHIISFNTTQIILLVERRYLLTKFTPEQMLNVVRLQVEDESEMSLELIRFTRQQLQEGQHN